MPKYIKTGQVDLYKKEPESNVGAVIFWAFVILIVVTACNGG